jgi:hypothetical protein
VALRDDRLAGMVGATINDVAFDAVSMSVEDGERFTMLRTERLLMPLWCSPRSQTGGAETNA